MTVHLAVSFLTLVLLCWTLRSLARSKEAPPRTSWVPLLLALVLALPLGFGPIIPISHYVFEATSDNITWYVVLYAAVWGMAGFFLWRCLQKGLDLAGVMSLGTIWAIMGFWYVLGVRLSQYEPGTKTPAVTDSVIYLVHWASVHLVLIALFFILVASPMYRRGWLCRVVTGGLFVPYIVLVNVGIRVLTQWIKVA